MHTGGRGDEEEDWVPCRGRRKKKRVQSRFAFCIRLCPATLTSGPEKRSSATDCLVRWKKPALGWQMAPSLRLVK